VATFPKVEVPTVSPTEPGCPSVRLFMAPGMALCGGDVGPNSFGQQSVAQGDPEHNLPAALERWVEQDIHLLMAPGMAHCGGGVARVRRVASAQRE
jgi:hypothetical protein